MTQAVAGWYPDPAGGPLSRWWDGQQWTEATMPAPAYAASGYPPSGYAPSGYSQPGYGSVAASHPAYRPVHPSNRTFFQANRYTCLATGFAAGYLLLAVFAHLVVLGIVPVLMSVRAFRAKERYAAASAAVAGLALVIGIAHLM
ncbi:MAG TPA: DUF2510 domain-containing protein [Jatrophihabitans sp.]|nr:DUF2510 domain-containing protein [Jatrophihabitans sp.]